MKIKKEKGAEEPPFLPFCGKEVKVWLDLLNHDGACGADLYAGLAAEAVIGPCDNGLVILEIIDLCRASVYALLIALALVVIDSDLKHGFLLF